jgi:hypothetical protein
MAWNCTSRRAPRVVQRGGRGTAPRQRRQPGLLRAQGGVRGRAWLSNARAAAGVWHASGARPRDGGCADATASPGEAAVGGGAG